jgi:DNA repair protein RadC
MKIKDIPWFNRPGFKLTRKGVNSLDDAELLSIIFWANDKEEDILSISNKILKKYNFHKLENAGYKELVNLICGKKKAEYKDFVKVMKLLSLVELSKRYNKLVNKGYKRSISCAKDVYDMFVDEMRNYGKEVFKVVLLDTKNKIINVRDISVGTLNSSLIHPREVFKEAIRESAYSVMLVHNHPSGNPGPSRDDIEMTKKIISAGKLLGILVLDHVIIGKSRYWNWLDNQS